MNCKLITVFALSMGIFSSVFSANPAPAAKTSAAKKCDVTFDAKTLSFVCGTKKLQFTKAGSYSVIANNREVAKGDFQIGTPAGWFSTNWGAPVNPKGFNGIQMCVMNLKPEGKKITFDGKIPWNKKGTPVIGGDWKIVAEVIDGGKIKVEWTYVVPQGCKRNEDGIFIEMKQCKRLNAGAAGTWIPGTPVGKKYIYARSKTILTQEGIQSADTYRMESSCWKMQGTKLRLLGNDKPCITAVFDLNEIPTATAGK